MAVAGNQGKCDSTGHLNSDIPLILQRENADVFSTAVDEKTLDAARQRNRKLENSRFTTEDWEVNKPPPLIPTEIVEKRAREQ